MTLHIFAQYRSFKYHNTIQAVSKIISNHQAYQIALSSWTSLIKACWLSQITFCTTRWNKIGIYVSSNWHFFNILSTFLLSFVNRIAFTATAPQVEARLVCIRIRTLIYRRSKFSKQYHGSTDIDWLNSRNCLTSFLLLFSKIHYISFSWRFHILLPIKFCSFKSNFQRLRSFNCNFVACKFQ